MTTATPDYQPYLKGTAIERDFATRRELPIALAHELWKALDHQAFPEGLARLLILDRLWMGCEWAQKEACHAELRRLMLLRRNA